jgi:hypothetical protein
MLLFSYIVHKQAADDLRMIRGQRVLERSKGYVVFILPIAGLWARRCYTCGVYRV